MILTGVFANAATIIIGALMGIVFKKGVPEKMNTSISHTPIGKHLKCG